MEGGGLKENRGNKLDYTRNTLMVQILQKGRVRLKLTMPTSDGLTCELPISFHTLSRDGDSTPLRPSI